MRAENMEFNTHYRRILFKRYIVFIILIVSYIPSILLLKFQFTDSFHYLTLSIVNYIQTFNIPYIDYSIDFPGDELIFLILVRITNLSLMDLKNIPIGSIVVPLCYFTLSKKLLKSRFLALLVSIYPMIDPTIVLGTYNTFTYAFTTPLYLLFVFIYYKYVFERKCTSDFILLLIIFLFLYITHPTYAIWCIFLSFAYSISMLIFSFYVTNTKQKLTYLYNFSVILCVIFLTFNSIIYKQILPKMFMSDKYTTIDFFFTQISSVFSSNNSIPEYCMTTTTSPIWDISRTLRLVIILIPVFFFFITIIIKIIKKDIHSASNHTIFIFSNIFTATFAIVSYTAYGHVSLRYVILVFPIISLMCILSMNEIMHTKKKYLAYLFLVFLLFFSAISVPAAFNSPFVKSTANFYETQPSSLWAMKNINEDTCLLMDLSTMYIYFMDDFNTRFKYLGYDSQIYDSLVDLNSDKKLDCDYVVINNKLRNNPTVAVGWKYYEPLDKYYSSLNKNSNINRIYNDNFIHIYSAQ